MLLPSPWHNTIMLQSGSIPDSMKTGEIIMLKADENDETLIVIGQSQ